MSLPESGSRTVSQPQRISTRRPSDSQTGERGWEARDLPLCQNSPSSRQAFCPSIPGVSPSVMVMAPVPPSSNASFRAMHWLRLIGRDQIPASWYTLRIILVPNLLGNAWYGRGGALQWGLVAHVACNRKFGLQGVRVCCKARIHSRG